jgi:hypothetical protein
VLDAPVTTGTYSADILVRMRQRVADTRDGERLILAAPLVDQVFDAQRAHILAARRDGVYSTEALAVALTRVDAMQLGIGITRRGRIDDHDE